MKRYFLYAGIALLIVGNIGRTYATRYTYVSADGVLHDTLWLPISAIMLLVGVVVLVAAGFSYTLENRKQRKQMNVQNSINVG